MKYFISIGTLMRPSTNCAFNRPEYNVYGTHSGFRQVNFANRPLRHENFLKNDLSWQKNVVRQWWSQVHFKQLILKIWMEKFNIFQMRGCWSKLHHSNKSWSTIYKYNKLLKLAEFSIYNKSKYCGTLSFSFTVTMQYVFGWPYSDT